MTSVSVRAIDGRLVTVEIVADRLVKDLRLLVEGKLSGSFKLFYQVKFVK